MLTEQASFEGRMSGVMTQKPNFFVTTLLEFWEDTILGIAFFYV